MNVSLRELVVLIRRVLFSLRVPTHATLSASRLIAQLEMREGKGLAYLEDLLSQPLDWDIKPRAAVASDGVMRIDAGGGSALLLGPAVLDTACAHAKARGVGIVLAESIGGLPFATVLDELGTRRGIATLVAVARSRTLVPLVTALAGASTVPDRLEAVNASVHAVSCTRLVGDESARSEPPPAEVPAPVDLIAAWVAPGEAGAPELAAETRAAYRWPAVAEIGDLLVACRYRSAAAPRGDEAEWVAERGYDWVQMDRVGAGGAAPWERLAVSRGIEVCASLWSRLEEQVWRGLAPASDRSRLDAGADPTHVPD